MVVGRVAGDEVAVVGELGDAARTGPVGPRGHADQDAPRYRIRRVGARQPGDVGTLSMVLISFGFIGSVTSKMNNRSLLSDAAQILVRSSV